MTTCSSCVLASQVLQLPTRHELLWDVTKILFWGSPGVGRPGIWRPGVGRNGIGRPGVGRHGIGRPWVGRPSLHCIRFFFYLNITIILINVGY